MNTLDNNLAIEDNPIDPKETLMNGRHIETSLSTEAITQSKHKTSKKKVNIRDSCDPICSETSEDSLSTVAAVNVTTIMVGTVKRGKKAGQSVDVKLNISREELELMENRLAANESLKHSPLKICSVDSGPHIVLLSVISFPFVLILCSLYSFYIGTLSWYNIFTYFTEHTNILYRISLPPFLILLYPFYIIILTFGLGLYSAVVQVSWYYSSWKKEIFDWEKGFYGWLCSFVNLEICSPYEVVVLTEIKSDNLRTTEKDSQDSILS